MLAKTALLIITNPKQFDRILNYVPQVVKKTLYIQLTNSLTGQFNKLFNIPRNSQQIFSLYSKAATFCPNLDVRVLLSGLKFNVFKVQTKNPIDLVIFDRKYDEKDLKLFVEKRIENAAEECKILVMDTSDDACSESEFLGKNWVENKLFNHLVIGGTFDRLHSAHKLLLSEAILRTNHKITVGVTEENMLKGKLLWELIQETEIRKRNVLSFMQEICCSLEYKVQGIEDPFGPSIKDGSMDAIIVSQETQAGGEKVNKLRLENKLNPLELVVVQLINEPNPKPNEETKISSSTGRLRLLGSLLKEPQEKLLPRKPFIIGLTGGIASGKTNVASNLQELGAYVINCDLVAHEAYKKNTNCYKKIVEHFGQRILNRETQEICRKSLGTIVFENPKELEELNQIVWPEIALEVQHLIKENKDEIIVIEAAVLLRANWDEFCHEVWTTIIPQDEAIQRLISRNGLSQDQALNRIKSQPTNRDYVQKSNVVFCSLWTKEATKEQVQHAWNLLQKRIL